MIMNIIGSVVLSILCAILLSGNMESIIMIVVLILVPIYLVWLIKKIMNKK